MKRSSNQQPLKEAIDQFLNIYRLDKKLMEINIVSSWEKLMGKAIANHTKEIYIKNKILYLHLDSAALREELSYGKEKIISLLNTEAGQKTVESIVFK